MTPTARRTSKIAVTGVSLAGLMAFGTWLVQTMNATRASQQAAAAVEIVDRYVTIERWRADSARRDDQFRLILGELRELRMDNAQRLREICVALRAGCR
jgi:esterase/lipase